MITPGVRSLPLEANSLLLERVRTFTEFSADNDPYQSTISAPSSSTANATSGKSSIAIR
ncbi:MAG: hypothetical protein WA418_34460 [Bradyrhizobium sp.]